MLANAIVIAERGGPISLLTAMTDGGWARSLVAAKGQWPTANPRRPILAHSVVGPGSGGVSSVIALTRGDGSPHGLAHTTLPGVAPVIAPRIPHYLNWSPDGATLSFVAPAPGGLALYLSDADGAYSSDQVAEGAPVFSAWNSAGTQLAVHLGDEVFIHDVRTRQRTDVSSRALGFRTPAWVGSRVYYGEPGESGVELHWKDSSTGARGGSGAFRGGVALAARPGTPAVAVAVAEEPESGVFNRLWLVDGDGDGARSLIHRGPFVSYFWDPTGASVALIVPTQIGDGRYAVWLRDPSGRFLAATEGFVPAPDYRMLLGFFDQYAHSHRLWSPDGGAFLAWGRLAGDAVAASFADSSPRDYVLMWKPGGGLPVEQVVLADSGFFAPWTAAQ